MRPHLNVRHFGHKGLLSRDRDDLLLPANTPTESVLTLRVIGKAFRELLVYPRVGMMPHVTHRGGLCDRGGRPMARLTVSRCRSTAVS